MIYIGKILLGYQEEEVWEMTLGKLITMLREYKKDHGLEEKKADLDEAIPF
jgi:hypothetical protein